MSLETYPGQHAANRAHDAHLDANGPALYSPAEVLVTRERLGLTRKALGERLGVSERAVARWEDGERKMLTAHADALTELVERADKEVARSVRAIERLTDGERRLVIYRNDRHLAAHHPASTVTAGWGRAIAGRVASKVNVQIEYAP